MIVEMKSIRIVSLAFFCVPALAIAEPAALVMEVQGAVTPHVDRFQELEVGTTIEIASGGQLTIEHFKTCESTTVSGGSVTVGRNSLRIDGSYLVERAVSQCMVALQVLPWDSVKAGVVLRSIVLRPTVPARPEFVISHPDLARFDRVTIEQSGNEVVSLPLMAGRATWPAQEGPLHTGTEYSIFLRGNVREFQASVMVGDKGSGIVILRP